VPVVKTDPAVVRRAIAKRDAASARVRRLTGVALAGAAALTGVFTALAAGSTHPRKVVRRVERPRAAAVSRKPVVAPAPPLVAADSAPAGQAAEASAPPPVSAPPDAGPVVVSGGS
jgi:hypothetical protein